MEDNTILLVEDNPTNLKVMQGLLKVLGVDFSTANNGKQAVTMLEEHSSAFDLVLMDCEMPVMDGYQATEKWRQIEEGHGLSRKPIIALTAHAVETYKKRCFESGMDDHLSKPVSLAQLKETLQKWLST